MSDVNPLPVCVLTALFGFLAAAFPAAGGPAREPLCPAPEARQFDFWIGEWNVTNLNRPSGGGEWTETGTATNRVYAVVGGCAVVEHWSGEALGTPPLAIEGFSVRAFDPQREVWDLVLLWPIQGPTPFGTPSGRFSGGRGDFLNHFVNPEGDTIRTRLSFSRIEDDSFQWNNGFSADGGATWDSTWIMRFRRRRPDAPALDNGPTASTDRCPGEGHRRFDDRLGEWQGERIAGGDTIRVTATVQRILEGCAVMERIRAADGAWESFAVRAMEPGGGWAEYGLATDRPYLRRREADAGAVVFSEVRPADGSIRRARGVEGTPREIVRIEEEAASSAGPWRAVAELRLRRRD